MSEISSIQDTWILLPAAVTLAAVLICEKRRWQHLRLLTKIATSSLFIVAFFLQRAEMVPFSLFLLGGLILCMGGDIFLALPQRRMFLLGLISFLLGHVGYGLAFLQVQGGAWWVLPAGGAVCGASAVVFSWLRPHLGKMRLPVLLYVLVITAMVIAAIMAASNAALSGAARLTILVGAVAFYLSDLAVARNRFVKQEHINRVIGLPIYYAAQFILAFTAALVKP